MMDHRVLDTRAPGQ